jgi:hypothetical protein
MKALQALGGGQVRHGLSMVDAAERPLVTGSQTVKLPAIGCRTPSGRA